MNFILGSKSTKSIVGLKICSSGYWSIYSGFIFICAALTAVAVFLARSEQALKEKYGGVNMVPSDIRLSGMKIAIFIAVGFCGGFIAAALGFGGGIIYNPVLLAFGLPPMVASASSLYLITFSKVASTLVYFMNGQLDVQYGFWSSMIAIIGSCIAVPLSSWYIKRSGRQSIIVWTLVFIFVVAITILPTIASMRLKKAH